MESVKLKAADGYTICLCVYEAEHPVGCIQVLHGMEEHQMRYREFAKRLCREGFTVVTSDMRGHGKEAPEQGFFREKDGAVFLLSDQKRITSYIQKRFGVKRVHIFAHSMGTVVARNLLQKNSQDYESVILSGYPNYPGWFRVHFALALTRVMGVLRGKHYHSKLVEVCSVGTFNKKIKNPCTRLDWLTNNEEEIQKYIADPYCGQGFCVSAFGDLFRLLIQMEKAGNYTGVRKDLPLLLMRGAEDPVTGFDKGAKQSEGFLRRVGFSHIQTRVYKGMRHEILNERDKDRVIRDIIYFYKEQICHS